MTPERALELRARFPIFAERMYFATQCMGPILEDTLVDLDEYRRSMCERKRVIPAWSDRLDDMSALLEQLLNAPPSSVALLGSATACQAAIASTLEPSGARTRIVTTDLAFHSSLYLWRAQALRGFEIVEVRSEDGIHYPMERILSAIDERTAAVAMPLVSPKSGALLDARAISARAREVGACSVLDAYQAVGAVPVDVRALDADVVVGGTHKWLCGGGLGLAFMYVRPALAATMQPRYPGWIGHQELHGFSDRYTPHAGARRFQQGTPALEPVYTARAGVRFVLEVGIEQLRSRSIALSERTRLRAIEHGIRVRSPSAAAARGGTLCLDLESPEAVVDALEARGVDVDSRPGAGLRLSPHPCSTEAECDQVIDSIAALVAS